MYVSQTDKILVVHFNLITYSLKWQHQTGLKGFAVRGKNKDYFLKLFAGHKQKYQQKTPYNYHTQSTLRADRIISWRHAS